MICFVVFAIKYVSFAILQVVQMSIGHPGLTSAVSTAQLVSKSYKLTSIMDFRTKGGGVSPKRTHADGGRGSEANADVRKMCDF